MTTLAVRHIGRLVTMLPMADDPLGIIENAAVVCEAGQVVWVGADADLASQSLAADAQVLDAGGRLVSPGLIEPHAHPIYAGSRAEEFDLRARGATYLEIQARGGGILSTVRATRAATDDALVAGTRRRLDAFLGHGVTTCEAKSGYALDVEGELRLLRLLRRACDGHAVELSPTLLAHVPPPGEDRATFIARFIDEAIPGAARGEGGRPLAEAVDVFCDAGAFTIEETRSILSAAWASGLALRVHAEQLTHTGAARLAAEMGARSVEHLEELAAADIPPLARAGTVCTLLPGAALTLRLPFPDARRLLDGGCMVALGTDCNPGSSLSENLPLMMSLGCMQMGMSCAEAWHAVTIAAARAVGRPDRGWIGPGARADLVVWEEDDPRALVQHYGDGRASIVVAGGQRVL